MQRLIGFIRFPGSIGVRVFIAYIFFRVYRVSRAILKVCRVRGLS